MVVVPRLPHVVLPLPVTPPAVVVPELLPLDVTLLDEVPVVKFAPSGARLCSKRSSADVCPIAPYETISAVANTVN